MTTSELGFYDFNIPCLAACPVHTNAGAYVAAIADGDDRFAYLTARLPNPFASVCGRVCAAPCEDACRRGEIDQPIAIRALKRFVTEKYGPESGQTNVWSSVDPRRAPSNGKSVAVVGGGPASLSCAHDLMLQGYDVSLYEATDRLGGMMVLGIPEYRLPRDLIDSEIQAIVDLGLDVHLNTRLGEDVSLDELRRDNDAVFLGIGAMLGRDLDIPGHDADGVFRAVEFLLNINQGFHVDIGEKVVVIGGGQRLPWTLLARRYVPLHIAIRANRRWRSGKPTPPRLDTHSMRLAALFVREQRTSRSYLWNHGTRCRLRTSRSRRLRRRRSACSGGEVLRRSSLMSSTA